MNASSPLINKTQRIRSEICSAVRTVCQLNIVKGCRVYSWKDFYLLLLWSFWCLNEGLLEKQFEGNPSYRLSNTVFHAISIVAITGWLLSVRPKYEDLKCSTLSVHLSPQSQTACWQDPANMFKSRLNQDSMADWCWNNQKSELAAGEQRRPVICLAQGANG